jgi:hypothetical protein
LRGEPLARLRSALAANAGLFFNPRAFEGMHCMFRAFACALLMLPLASCLAGAAIHAAGATAGAAVGVTGAVVSTTVKTTGAVAGAVLPHDDHDKGHDRHD